MDPFNNIKNKGNQLFRQQRYYQALTTYQQAINEIQLTNNQYFLNPSTSISNIYVALLTNASLASIKIMAIKYASIAITVDGKNAKALYRRGLAYKQLAQLLQLSKRQLQHDFIQLYQKAKINLELLNMVETQNPKVKQKLTQINHHINRIPQERQQQINLITSHTFIDQIILNSFQSSTQQNLNNNIQQIMEEYQAQEVTQLVQPQIKQYQQLPTTQQQLQKVIRTIQQSSEVFLELIWRVDQEYLNKIEPTFDVLGSMINHVTKYGKGEKAANFIKVCIKQKSFELFWKSLLNQQKQQFKAKCQQLGVNKEKILQEI